MNIITRIYSIISIWGILFISTIFPQNQISKITSNNTPSQDDSLKSSGQKYYWRFEIKIGQSHRIADLSDKILEADKDHVEQLKKGSNVSLSVIVLKENWGIGLQFSRFKASHSSNEIFLIDDSGFIMGIGSRKDDTTVLFIGAESIYQYKINPKVSLYAKLALGYVGYTNDVNFLDSSIKYLEKSMGINSTIGLEYHINNHIGINIDFSLLQAESMQIGNSTSVEKENTDRYDLNVGFLIYL